MTHEVMSVACGGVGLIHSGPSELIVRVFDNRDNAFTPCQSYQHLLEDSDSECLILVHDDVTIHDADWLERVMAEFTPGVVAVGLGGALALGHPDLYKKPYRLNDLARYGYRSNQTDWQTHGEQETRSCRVAVLDAFFMAVRRDWLMARGGWPVSHLTHHCLDTWLACEAAKDGKEIRMVGVSVSHHGGGSSTKPTYREAKWLQGHSMEEDHRLPHRWIYETYRGVLPFQVKP